MRLTILSENSVSPAPDIIGEHGFSVLIERDHHLFLFDTGQGNCLVNNAACLKKDLRLVNGIILSHGHFDHTGGLKQVLALRSSPVPVYCHPGVFTERFAQIKTGNTHTYRNISMPHPRTELEALGARFVLNTAFTEIAPGMYLTGEVPRETLFEKNDPRLVILQEGAYVPDTIPDDQSLVLSTAQGLVVVLGCAHAGIINTLTHIANHLPGQSLHMVIGGTHLGYLDKQQVADTIAQFKSFSIERIGVSHCTGLAAACQLKQVFGDRFFFATAGSEIIISA
jgi:7,8-dihydropterin-6-yl-methyl-4-(beta-D-ribofuranosyl)aminobenzene 5'-phosphate synthase